MGQFLRDQKLQHLNLDEGALDVLNAVFIARVAARNAALVPNPQMPQLAPAPQPVANPGAQAAQAVQAVQGAQAAQAAQVAQVLHKMAFLSYIIRFDEKGYRLTNFVDVKQHYDEARRVERVIFLVDSGESRQSGSVFGTQVELRLDARDANNCYLTVTADDKQWVDDTFAALIELLGHQRNLSGWVRTQWTGAVIQLLGVSVGFLLSVWASSVIAPKLDLDNAFAVSLLFALLIFGNVWGYLNTQIIRLIDIGFPNLRFRRKDKEGFRWLIRGVIVGLMVAALLWGLKELLTNAATVLKTFLK